MEQDIQTIKRLIFQLRKEFGNIVAIDELKRLAIEENIGSKDVTKAIKALEEEGLVKVLDDDSIEVNA